MKKNKENKENKENKAKAFTLIEILISISIMAIIIISIYSFKIFVSSYIDYLIFTNNLKAFATKIYYESILGNNQITAYIMSNDDEKSVNIDGINIKFRSLSLKVKEFKDQQNNKITCYIRLEKCEIKAKYRNKEKVITFQIPLIGKRIVIGNPNINPINPIEGNPIIYSSKSF